MSHPSIADRPVEAGPKQAVAQARSRQCDRGLLLVGVFKLSKAIFFGSVGIASLHLIHNNVNLSTFVLHWTDKLPVDPEGRLVNLLMEKAGLIGSRELRRFGLMTFAYALVCVVEGTGLMMQKVWAEYITLTLTALALPWEVYEIVHRPSTFRIGLLILNIGVLVYLAWVIRKKRHERSGGEHACTG